MYSGPTQFPLLPLLELIAAAAAATATAAAAASCRYAASTLGNYYSYCLSCSFASHRQCDDSDCDCDSDGDQDEDDNESYFAQYESAAVSAVTALPSMGQ